jgi:hypothetical protein
MSCDFFISLWQSGATGRKSSEFAASLFARDVNRPPKGSLLLSSGTVYGACGSFLRVMSAPVVPPLELLLA